MPFPLLDAHRFCDDPACRMAPRAALALPDGSVLHVCAQHLLSYLPAGEATYPVVQLAGVALRPQVAPSELRLVQ